MALQLSLQRIEKAQTLQQVEGRNDGGQKSERIGRRTAAVLSILAKGGYALRRAGIYRGCAIITSMPNLYCTTVTALSLYSRILHCTVLYYSLLHYRAIAVPSVRLAGMGSLSVH